jgi:hypothetical protein
VTCWKKKKMRGNEPTPCIRRFRRPRCRIGRGHPSGSPLLSSSPVWWNLDIENFVDPIPYSTHPCERLERC